MHTTKLTTINKYSSYFFNAVVLSAIAIGAALRLYGLGQESMRLDEAQSVWQASHSINFIKSYMVQNIHLPLHNVLLHWWMKFVGTEEVSVRLMSAIPGILSLPALYLLAWEIFQDKKKALITLLIAAISPFWIWYSREIRMYTLLTLVSSLSYYFYLRILKENRPVLFTFFIAVNVLGIYTHYFFNFVLLIQALFFIIAKRQMWFRKVKYNAKELFIRFTLSAAVVYLVFLPWVLYFIVNHAQGGSFAPELEKPSSFNVVLSFFEFALGYQPENLTAAIIALWPLSVLIGFIFLTKRKNPLTPGVYLAFFGTVVPVVLVYLISIFISPIYLTRYLIHTTPLFMVAVAWLLTEMQGSIRQLSMGVFFVIIMLALYNQKKNPENPARENYRDAVAYVNSVATDRDVIVVSPPYTLYPVYYYYDLPNKVVSMPIWDKRELSLPPLTPQNLETDSTLIQEGHRRIFLITTLNLAGGYDVERYLDLNYTRLDKKQFSKFVWVETYQAEYPDLAEETNTSGTEEIVSQINAE